MSANKEFSSELKATRRKNDDVHFEVFRHESKQAAPAANIRHFSSKEAHGHDMSSTKRDNSISDVSATCYVRFFPERWRCCSFSDIHPSIHQLTSHRTSASSSSRAQSETEKQWQ